MKFILRVLGTWALGLALILVIIDVVRSFGEGAVAITSLQAGWQAIDPVSYENALQGIMTNLQPYGLMPVVDVVMATPGWVVFAVLGLVFLILGRKRASKGFITTR